MLIIDFYIPKTKSDCIMPYSHNHPKQSHKLSRLKQLGVLLCMLPSLANAQEEIIVFHNTENLFYPTDDTLTLDDDFTINGKKHWTFKKYKNKLNSLAKTYISIDSKQMPALIGLCEIENNTVLDNLTQDTPLRKVGYKYIHYPSNDIRGIDVALLYDPKKFKIIDSFPLPRISQREEDRTRDVLYVKGILDSITLNIYVLHAPSRRENNIKKDLRQHIFENIYQNIEKLKQEGETNFIIMGDFNDNPWDETVSKGFKLQSKHSNTPPLLTNLMSNNKDKAGSYVFSGTLFSFDQFIVSEQIKQRLVFDTSCNQTFVYKPNFLILQDKRQRYDRPSPTYKGMRYAGGISDHFPIVMRLNTVSNK